MIPKLITSNSFDYKDPSVSLVRFHRGGVDRDTLRKTASHNVFEEFLRDYKPPKDRVVIQVLAVGDDEFYGPNRNCDGFSREDNKTAHKTFKDLGFVFRGHQHDDPEKAVGDVIHTAHNGPMSRIELLLGLDPEKCPKEVQAVENGEDVPVSMGTAQDYDVCSYCGNQAKTAKDHCEHIKKHLGHVAEDGSKIYMKNPNPKYFDISLVHKPADRIAYTMRKIAMESGTEAIGGHQLAEIYGWNPAGFEKAAAMRRIASIVKDVPGTIRKATSPTRISADNRKELVKQAQIHGAESLISHLTERKLMLSPGDLGEVLGADGDTCEQAVDECKTCDKLYDDEQTMKVFDGKPSTTPIHMSDDLNHDLKANASMESAPVKRRMLIASISPGISKKTASVVDPSFMRGFADLYNGYRVSFALHHQSDSALLRDVAATF